ncbi:transglycosylase SLT domain-containing protein [Aliifodinibius sp. S!AR15-10]|uniref:transglycosylase SLT domain-containing protein n=1 Tax=Aliifodinibius sp. S!AR15-10 TaxID=2950437 RepID=UPI00285FC47B|nr:transglycosylase SLT domain-containing protein [Aliifodinibius sp. S!AR15-10]MDR8390006.1 transglycosylase SLT domain-containing protein [Aliifodinibius sp. S!AR15-10]
MSSPLSISVELTYVRLRGLMGYFQATSKKYGLPLALLLAVASRESRMGLALSADGTGDRGHGIGVMQIDKRYHPGFTRAHDPFDHQANIDYGGRYLGVLLRDFGGDILQAVAAYNAGPANVRKAVHTGLPPDVVTTGGDYASDIQKRANLIRRWLGMPAAASQAVYLVPAGLLLLLTYNYLTTRPR